MRAYSLDTNCFIDTFSPASATQRAMQAILEAAAKAHRIALWVSRHTLSELTRDDEATVLARSLPALPHYPIGTSDEQVGTWDKLAGTWDDAKRNEDLQIQIKALAHANVSIRDRGGLIDALASKLDGFVTSDKGLVAPGPASKINAVLATKVLTPIELAGTLER